MTSRTITYQKQKNSGHFFESDLLIKTPNIKAEIWKTVLH